MTPRHVPRRPAWLWLPALVLLLAGPALAQSGNPAHDALQAQGDAARRQALLQGLRSAGNACTNVILAFHAGFDAERAAYWDLRCADGATYRARLPADRFARPGFLRCGAAAPAPRGGPCFQAVTAAPPPAANQSEQACISACAAQPGAAQTQCVPRCVAGFGLQVGTQLAEALPPGSRFGAIYHTDNPVAAFGFGNGQTDRLAVNMAAVRACQAMAGPVPCRFQGELVNQCGALAFALSRHPSALVMTSDISTQVLNLAAIGRGASQQSAEAVALQACRRAEGPGVQCRIMASGC